MLMRHVHPTLQFTHMLPYGAILHENGVQFVVYSRSATAMRLLLYEKVDDAEPEEIIEFNPSNDRWGDIWSIFVPGVSAGQLYHFQADGPRDPERGQWFDGKARLIDPYAKALAGNFLPSPDGIIRPPKCVVVDDYFDWEGDRHLRREHQRDGHLRDARPRLHARQIEQGRASRHVPGPDRKDSVSEIARRDGGRADAGARVSDQRHLWPDARAAQLLGLRPDGVFRAAPRLRASATSRAAQVTEFKQMVKALHAAGIEVILDVVFNHTCEGNELGPTLSLQGAGKPASTTCWATAAATT